jgi:hypothetical protein
MGENNDSALHTDICSVLPTDPVWRCLPKEVRANLAASGIPLWQGLVEFLQPDVLLWSTARAWFDRIPFAPISPESPLVTFTMRKDGKTARKTAYTASKRWFDIAGHRTLVVFGIDNRVPFGSLSDVQKAAVGKAARATWDRAVDGSC